MEQLVIMLAGDRRIRKRVVYLPVSLFVLSLLFCGTHHTQGIAGVL